MSSNGFSKTGVAERLASWASGQGAAYRSQTDEDRPLTGYSSALAVYGGVVGAVLAAARATGRSAPERVTPMDVLLLGLATHKTSRILAKDAVTSPLRAPFTVYDKPTGDAELGEHSREQHGPKHAIGELITCPFCLAQWVATGFVAGRVFAPGFTRLATLTMAGVAVSDFLQLAYAELQALAG